MCVCVCVTKLTCMRGFTVEARPLRFRRIKVTGKNQQGRKCWSPCLIYQHLAKHKQRGGVPPPAAAERRGQSHIAAALQIRRGSVSINKRGQIPPEEQMREPSFTLGPLLFFPPLSFCFCRVMPCHPIYPKQSASVSSLQADVGGDPAALRQSTPSF